MSVHTLVPTLTYKFHIHAKLLTNVHALYSNWISVSTMRVQCPGALTDIEQGEEVSEYRIAEVIYDIYG